jgi:hypothetical protein
LTFFLVRSVSASYCDASDIQEIVTFSSRVKMPNGPQSSGVAAPQAGESGLPAATDADFSKTSAFVLWSKYEDVAMHFNDLIMKLRTQALAGLAGVVTVAGLAVSFTGKTVTTTEWEVLFCTSVFLSVAWIALFILDIGYYNRLLRGAVEAIEEHEALTHAAPAIDRIILSTRISAAAKHHMWSICGFYLLVLCGLGAGIGVTLHKWSSITNTPSSANKLEFTFDRGPMDGVDLKIAPAGNSPSGTHQPTPTTSTTVSPPASPRPSVSKGKSGP